MEVVYNLTAEDFLAFNRFHLLGTNKTVRWFRRLRWPLMVLGCILFPLWFVPMLMIPLGDNTTQSKYGPLFIVPLLLCLSPLIYHVTIEARLREGVRLHAQGVVGVIRLILTEETMTEITESIRTEVHWNHVLRIIGDENNTFIFVRPGAAVILPRHGFRSDEEYERARGFAVERLNRARSVSPEDK